MLTVGSLFSGIGGMDLGLEQAGMKTVWQVEFDDWARGKLDEIFPHTEKFIDVRESGKHNLSPIDIIAGGFPCTDISVSNTNGKGLDGERSGLWFEMFRIIRELRPRYALIENVPNLLVRGLDRVLSDLASIGYDAEWQTLRASAFGLPTRRKRLFIVAFPCGVRPIPFSVFNRTMLESYTEWSSNSAPVLIESIGRSYPQIPEHLRVDNGVSFELSEIEAAIKGYGNAVAPPVAKWIGEQIIKFDSNVDIAPTQRA